MEKQQKQKKMRTRSPEQNYFFSNDILYNDSRDLDLKIKKCYKEKQKKILRLVLLCWIIC